MAAPKELSIESVRNFICEKGGKVTNKELVKHFKPFLTHPEHKEESCKLFKDYVNALATIQHESDEKYLVLKKRFRGDGEESPNIPVVSPPIGIPTPIMGASFRQPPPYRPPPQPYTSPPIHTDCPPATQRVLQVSGTPNSYVDHFRRSSLSSSVSSLSSIDRGIPIGENEWVEGTDPPPPVPPRNRRGTFRDRKEDKERENNDTMETNTPTKTQQIDQPPDLPCLTVKERTQRFNKIAIESEQSRLHTPSPKKTPDKSTDDGDSASLNSVPSIQLEPQGRQWLVAASKGDYQQLVKMLQENPRLAKVKDPFSGFSALHWAAKHGNRDIVKLIAGTHGMDANVKSHGGYTPLHIAAQFGQADTFDLLVETYSADQQLRDHSGKKPRQYHNYAEAAVSKDTYRKIKARRRSSEREAGFLRIGSLNVRVRKTTEAFGSLLGLAGTPSTPPRMRNHWGSADSLHDTLDRQLMPPPPVRHPVKKRKNRKTISITNGNGTAPSSEKDHRSSEESDGACGFGNEWQSTV